MKPNIYVGLCDLFVVFFITLLARDHYSRATSPSTLKYRTFGNRILAAIVDALVLWPCSTIPFILTHQLPLPIQFALWFFISFAGLTYSVAMHAKYGQTVGKMVCKVRVIDFKTEGRIGLRQALLRDSVQLLISVPLFAYLSLFVFTGKVSIPELYDPSCVQQSLGTLLWFMGSVELLWFVAEVVTMLTNKKRRAIHDFIAGTVVVRTNIEEEEVSQFARPTGMTPSFVAAREGED